jgi:hypothetical protein
MNSKKWAVYAAGNSSYILSENMEPVKMLKSFKSYFSDELDYIYFMDENEPDIDKVYEICQTHGIKLVLGDCKEHYSHYRDVEYRSVGMKDRWPDAVYWYCEAPRKLEAYDYLIKCDGDMMCNKHFSLNELEFSTAITIAESPSWYIPYDVHSPNAGFQIINVKEYVKNNVQNYFRELSKNVTLFNSDTPVLDYLVGSKTLEVTKISSSYNYLLFDIHQVKQLNWETEKEYVKIVHFVSSKPHNLDSNMKNSVKEKFAKIYESY